MEPVTHIMLDIFGNSFRIISYNINFSQNYNLNNGLVAGRVVGNLLEVSVISRHTTDFIEWMINDNKEEQGFITFYNGGVEVKQIEFTGADLVGYNQNLDKVTIDGQEQTVISEDLSISYQKLEFGGEEGSEIKFDKAIRTQG